MSTVSTVITAIVLVLFVAFIVGAGIGKFRDASAMYHRSSRTDSEREAPPNKE